MRRPVIGAAGGVAGHGQRGLAHGEHALGRDGQRVVAHQARAVRGHPQRIGVGPGARAAGIAGDGEAVAALDPRQRGARVALGGAVIGDRVVGAGQGQGRLADIEPATHISDGVVRQPRSGGIRQIVRILPGVGARGQPADPRHAVAAIERAGGEAVRLHRAVIGAAGGVAGHGQRGLAHGEHALGRDGQRVVAHQARAVRGHPQRIGVGPGARAAGIAGDGEAVAALDPRQRGARVALGGAVIGDRVVGAGQGQTGLADGQ